METKKIAAACFVGGVLCSFAALMFTPDYWWLGLLAGFAGGYVGYEFREVLRAIPVAWRVANDGRAFVWRGVVKGIREWRSDDHPFVYAGVFLTLPFVVWIAPLLIGLVWQEVFSFGGVVIGNMAVLLTLAEAVVIFGLLAALFAFIGARTVERCYWLPRDVSKYEQKWFEEKRAKGYREVPMTYANAIRWARKGIAATMIFLVCTMWIYVVIGIVVAGCFTGRFIWRLFQLVHSEKRVLCGMDGTFGGIASYFWLISPTASSMEQALLVLFGGLLGAVFGIASWEIISKRVFKVATSGA